MSETNYKEALFLIAKNEIEKIAMQFEKLAEKDFAQTQIIITVFSEDDDVQEILGAAKSKGIVTSTDANILTKVDKSIMGGFILECDEIVWDCSVRKRMLEMQRQLKQNKSAFLCTDNADELRQRLQLQLDDLHFNRSQEETGTVIQIGDGIARVHGLYECMNGELLEFSNGTFGMALNLEEDNVGCVLFSDSKGIVEGSKVKRTFKAMHVPVGSELLGRVLNPLGEPIDGGLPIKTEHFRPIEAKATGVTQRKPVTVPMQTGILTIDSMIPIGRGQRQLIIGDRQTGKTSIAVDAIINQRDTGVLCIYVAIGQKASVVASIVDTLTAHDAMKHTIVVFSASSDAAPLQYIAPYAACAMAEEFMFAQDKDVLVVYDDLSKHAVAYRTMSLLLKRPPGREAFPGDVFYLHSRLLERAARQSDALGGGSITALPIVETLAGDISAYIPTNVISITDGQIFLESELFHEGIRPAINLGLSVSRVGGAAQLKSMKHVAGSLRLELAQYRELQVFSQFGSDLDVSTRERLNHGEKLTAALKQGLYAPLRIEEQIIILYNAKERFLDNIPADEVAAYHKGLIAHFKNNGAELMQCIITADDLSDELLAQMKKLCTAYANVYKASNG